MATQPLIRTARLLLRPFSPDDAAAVQHLAGAREIADTTLNVPHPYPDGAAEEWIASHSSAFEAQQLAVYAITTADDLLGAVGLVLEPQHSLAELGYWVGTPYWGHGYATEAARALVAFGFAQLELNRIQARHFVRNPSSGRVMQKLGMRFEGILRQAIRKWDRFEDVALYALLASEWRELQDRNEPLR